MVCYKKSNLLLEVSISMEMLSHYTPMGSCRTGHDPERESHLSVLESADQLPIN